MIEVQNLSVHFITKSKEWFKKNTIKAVEDYSRLKMHYPDYPADIKDELIWNISQKTESNKVLHGT
ncbi:MAG: hypothetical protein N3A69_07325, partial [Leptospiraceae bacterium]|nr:hypothetical protein [Leptospiraceae bacterium]